VNKEELEKEINDCLDAIKGISDMLKDFYGTKEQYFEKIKLFNDYQKRLDNARKEYVKYIEEDLD
jgi:predicted transcriptional regulator of viral defense system